MNITKQKQTQGYREQTSGYQWGEDGGGAKWRRIKRYKLLGII